MLQLHELDPGRTVSLDFDGVCHSYSSGWRGAANIPDPPVPGMREEIIRIRAAGYQVAITSARNYQPFGMDAVKIWLDQHGFIVDAVTAEKVAAIAYVDDRAIMFTGDATGLLEKIQALRPWCGR